MKVLREEKKRIFKNKEREREREKETGSQKEMFTKESQRQKGGG